MKIDRRGREYVKWVIVGGDEDMTYDVTFDNITWYPTDVVGVSTITDDDLGVVVTGLKVQALVQGPDAPSWDAIVLSVGHNRAKLRVTDSPEIVIQDAGTVTVG